MTTEITRIKQADGTTRIIHAQDEEHAMRAREILRNDPAMIDHLNGVDGIEIRVDEAKKVKIAMSERRPLTIVDAEWPIIAQADRHDGGEVKSRANHEWTVRVRESSDGMRRLVYGWVRAGNGGVHAGWRGAEGGFLLSRTALEADEMEAETIRAIRRVAGIIDDDQLGDECIADLPAESLVNVATRNAEPGMTLAVSADKLARIFALLVQAVPHVPGPLKSEIQDAVRDGAR
jgi:hypothetical protein